MPPFDDCTAMAEMAPLRVKSFNVEEGREGRGRDGGCVAANGGNARRANSAPVFIVKTSYVDCGEGTNERDEKE